jgi:hypothetical protein
VTECPGIAAGNGDAFALGYSLSENNLSPSGNLAFTKNQDWFAWHDPMGDLAMNQERTGLRAVWAQPTTKRRWMEI